jgi:hypothetical protein
MTGTVYDQLGNTLNEGDLVMVQETCYKIVSIQVPQIESALTLKQPPPTIRLANIRMVSDITITVEANKKIQKVFKLQEPPKEPSVN